jgi:hypothetical protein
MGYRKVFSATSLNMNKNKHEIKMVGVTSYEIESRLKSGNACYHLVQNLLSSRLLSKNIKIRIYRTIISPVLCGCET